MYRLQAFLLGVMATILTPVMALDVQITETIEYVDVLDGGKTKRIIRKQDPTHQISGEYAKTSRKCPPFCITPMQLADGVETIGELEVIDYLQQKHAGDNNILLIDSRTPDWLKKGTIPGAINIPWTDLSLNHGANPISIGDIFTAQFAVRERDGLWDFSEAKLLVFFCNGIWCSQSPRNVKTLLTLGYPAHKIKWYRGGMQSWSILGLSTVIPTTDN